MTDIAAIGAYVPKRRLSCRSIDDANAWLGVGRNGAGDSEKAISGWDEDAITLAVDAARACLSSNVSLPISSLFFCSTSAPFTDRLNAGIVAEALSIEGADCVDMGGSQRCATSAIIAAVKMSSWSAGTSLIVSSERQRHPSASPRESRSGDGAGAIALSPEAGLAKVTGFYSYTTDFVDSYRASQQDSGHYWEDRWIREEGYLGILVAGIQKALDQTQLSINDFKFLCLPGPSSRYPSLVGKRLGFENIQNAITLHDVCGDTGSSYPILLLAKALELAQSRDRILLAGFGQGCDVLLLEVRDEIQTRRPTAISETLAQRRAVTNYLQYLTLNDQVNVDLGMRSEGDRSTSLSMLYRKRRMLYGLIGGECEKCRILQFPRSRICVNPSCTAVDSQKDARFSDLAATVATWSRDLLAFSYCPPACYGLLNFAPSGRMLVEFTDVDDVELSVGDPMRMVFRIIDYDRERKFPKYFWKATPIVRGAARVG
jgi:hydroxymethylglutaryl-CoA synthase